MARELSRCQLIERSINKKYRKDLWNPFVYGVKRYELIQPGDRIAVCLSGGRDSALLAKLLQELNRHTEVPFSLSFLTLDAGFSATDRAQLDEISQTLQIPVLIFSVSSAVSPDTLTEYARKIGCNKIALGQHFNDVIEHTMEGLFYSSRLHAMRPKEHLSTGIDLIRPLYCVHASSIAAWARYNQLTFLPQAPEPDSRLQVRETIATLMGGNPIIEKSIFNSIHAVCLDTLPGYASDGIEHSFLEHYENSAVDS